MAVEVFTFFPSGILLYEGVKIPYSDHLFRNKALRVGRADHFPEHLVPSDDGVQEFRCGNIGLWLILTILGGEELGGIGLNGFQLLLEYGCYIIDKGRVGVAVLDIME